MTTQGLKLPIISANEPVTAILPPCLGTILIAGMSRDVPMTFTVLYICFPLRQRTPIIQYECFPEHRSSNTNVSYCIFWVVENTFSSTMSINKKSGSVTM